MAVDLKIVKELVESKSQIKMADEHYDMTVEEAMSRLDEQGLRYEFEERAAILEYDGGLTREKAEAQALREIAERIDWMKKN